MLNIRLIRIGRKNQVKFRIVAVEHSASGKGRVTEILGYYIPTGKKECTFKEDRIKYWISKGAQPTDSVAALLKSKGVAGMEMYLEPRNKKRKNKSEAPEAKPEVKPETPKAEAKPKIKSETKPEVKPEVK